MEFKCAMCPFKAQVNSVLVQHVVKRHETEPRFRVSCSEDGCGATFRKWASFRKHRQRKHPLVQNVQQANPENLNAQRLELVNLEAMDQPPEDEGPGNMEWEQDNLFNNYQVKTHNYSLCIHNYNTSMHTVCNVVYYVYVVVMVMGGETER